MRECAVDSAKMWGSLASRTKNERESESLKIQKDCRRKVMVGSKEGVTCTKSKEQFQMSDPYGWGLDFR